MTQTAYDVSDINKVADSTHSDGLTKSLYHVGMEDYKDVFVVHAEHPNRGGGTDQFFVDIGMLEVTGQELDFELMRKFFVKYADSGLTDSQLRELQDALDKMADYYFWGEYEDTAGTFEIGSGNYVYTTTTNELRDDLSPLYEDIGIKLENRDAFEKALMHERIRSGAPDYDLQGGNVHIELTFLEVPDDVAQIAKDAITEWRKTKDGW
jgi:hypothetical protein